MPRESIYKKRKTRITRLTFCHGTKIFGAARRKRQATHRICPTKHTYAGRKKKKKRFSITVVCSIDFLARDRIIKPSSAFHFNFDTFFHFHRKQKHTHIYCHASFLFSLLGVFFSFSSDVIYFNSAVHFQTVKYY